jgi:hypothetical protein
MPDITVTFTDAQWVRIVAASRYILRIDEGDVDATKLAAKWKTLETDNVKAYEQANASIDDF